MGLPLDIYSLILGVLGLVLGGSAFGGIAGLIVAVTRNRSERRILEKKADAEERRSALEDMERVVDQYRKELERVHATYQKDISQLRDDLQKLQQRLDNMQKEHGGCERRCATMEGQLETMRALLEQHGIRAEFGGGS